jgi:hypothetical protein
MVGCSLIYHPYGIYLWSSISFSTDILSLRDSVYHFQDTLDVNKKIRRPADDISVEKKEQYMASPVGTK